MTDTGPRFAVGDFVSLAEDPSSYGQVVEIERYGDDGWMCSVDFGGPGLDGIEQSHLTTPAPEYFDTTQPVPINVDGPTRWTISVGDGQVTQFDSQGNEATPNVEIDGDRLTFQFAAPIVGEPKFYVVEHEPPDPFEQMADTGWNVQLLERWAPEYGGGWTASLGRHNNPDGPGAQGWGPTPAAAVADALEVVARIENREAGR